VLWKRPLRVFGKFVCSSSTSATATARRLDKEDRETCIAEEEPSDHRAAFRSVWIVK